MVIGILIVAGIFAVGWESIVPLIIGMFFALLVLAAKIYKLEREGSKDQRKEIEELRARISQLENENVIRQIREEAAAPPAQPPVQPEVKTAAKPVVE
ncbi:MAG: hypothetical protein GY950_37225, partial [bacterium]|nr:hypothetical protein [bacterium]